MAWHGSESTDQTDSEEKKITAVKKEEEEVCRSREKNWDEAEEAKKRTDSCAYIQMNSIIIICTTQFIWYAIRRTHNWKWYGNEWEGCRISTHHIMDHIHELSSSMWGNAAYTVHTAHIGIYRKKVNVLAFSVCALHTEQQYQQNEHTILIIFRLYVSLLLLFFSVRFCCCCYTFYIISVVKWLLNTQNMFVYNIML